MHGHACHDTSRFPCYNVTDMRIFDTLGLLFKAVCPITPHACHRASCRKTYRKILKISIGIDIGAWPLHLPFGGVNILYYFKAEKQQQQISCGAIRL